MLNELLRVENLSKSYPSEGKEGKLVILEDINLLLSPGETIAITGKSGCGKSTLLSLLALLSPKDGGKIFYEGIDTDLLKEKDLPRLRNEKMCFEHKKYIFFDNTAIYLKKGATIPEYKNLFGTYCFKEN